VPPQRPRTTRLAPSPTGVLHLGNARTFLLTWAIARQRGWRVILRIEDLDGPRIKPGATNATIDLLRWLGLDWDGPVLVQSDDPAPYIDAMQSLAARALAYPCDLSRAQIEAAASAPQEGLGEVHFPASLRPPLIPRAFDQPESGWRFAVPDTLVPFVDAFAGPQSPVPARTIGDFAIWTRRAQPAYQLAVVVDDHRQGVTDVIRGNDLLDSAARQILLYRALGYAPEPTYMHLPLVLGSDGRRLAKRHGDTRLDHYRDAGVRADRVIALVARGCGFGACDALSAAEFARTLDVTRIPPEPMVFRAEDDAWLLQR